MAAAHTRGHYGATTACRPAAFGTVGRCRPRCRAPRESVAEYWHLVIRKHLDHRPELVTEVFNLKDSVQLALELSAVNPMLEF